MLLAHPVAAQFTDSLKVVVGTTLTAATKAYQPLWITANRYGTLTDRQYDAATYLRLRNKHSLAQKPRSEASASTPHPPSLYIGYGVALSNHDHLQRTFLPELYAEVGYWAVHLRAGRYREVTGGVDPTLSSGSLGISGNALPIPKAELAVAEYTAVPFTRGWVQFKGQFAHGWLGDTPDIKGAFLHQKSLYLRFGKQRLTAYGGLTHFAQWGGTFSSGRAPSRFRDYLRILAGASGNAGDPVYQQGPIDVANAVGNHLLIPDFGIAFRQDKATWRLYTQTIFDKGVGDSSNTNKRDRLAGLKIFSSDRLVGLSWEAHHRGLLQQVVVEGIYTKHQGGPIIYQGRDNYYNNGTYTMGWQYQNRIIGTPLFLNRQTAERYGIPLDANVLRGWSVVSNRIAGLHVGLKGTLTPTLSYRLLATHVQHYGNYYNDAYFTPAKQQTHLLLELPFHFSHFSVTVAVGSDFGNLASSTAGLLRWEWFIR
ncbi:capsule assembly Wzi family protein [Hymenobacter arizonensis]|uniref:capsule assembly Wzi family protein n=1 Tax=Hymenobacter arizonensis TaxID=1227077 RepID=UPI0015A6FCEB|nr:capsule assembly Wzi family protein [Hymenobacter arizonensis]